MALVQQLDAVRRQTAAISVRRDAAGVEMMKDEDQDDGRVSSKARQPDSDNKEEELVVEDEKRRSVFDGSRGSQQPQQQAEHRVAGSMCRPQSPSRTTTQERDKRKRK